MRDKLVFVLCSCLGPFSMAQNSDFIWKLPRPLQNGEKIAFVAPAGPVDVPFVRLAAAKIEAMGFVVQVSSDIGRQQGYLAGSDEERVSEINNAIRDPSVRAIFACRGGYGTARILDQIDYSAIRSDPKVICGFSDITALHLAISRKSQVVSFHSPMPIKSLWSNEPQFGISNQQFWGMISSDSSEFHFPTVKYSFPSVSKPTCLSPGVARGRLTGGNLSIICSTLGTEYEIDCKDSLLFFEEVNEPLYRIDRMLAQLRLAGKLQTLNGVIIGNVGNNSGSPLINSETWGILEHYFKPLGIPVIADFPISHGDVNLTIPVGLFGEIDAEAGTLRLLSLSATELEPVQQ